MPSLVCHGHEKRYTLTTATTTTVYSIFCVGTLKKARLGGKRERECGGQRGRLDQCV